MQKVFQFSRLINNGRKKYNKLIPRVDSTLLRVKMAEVDSVYKMLRLRSFRWLMAPTSDSQQSDPCSDVHKDRPTGGQVGWRSSAAIVCSLSKGGRQEGNLCDSFWKIGFSSKRERVDDSAKPKNSITPLFTFFFFFPQTWFKFKANLSFCYNEKNY